MSAWLRIKNVKNIKTYKVIWFNSSEYKYKSKNFSYKNKNQEEILKEATNFSKTINKNNEYLTISVKEYLKLPKYVRHDLKGYKVGVEFPEKEVDLEPYALGYWLGDGTSAEAQITTQEEVVVEYFQKYIKQLGGYVHQGKDSAKCRASLHYTFRKCEFKNYLRKHNLLKNKHIPYIYKCNSRKNRLKLLAGLIDSDGYYGKRCKCYEIIQKNSKLSEDIVYLCRSLGFACYSKKCKKSCMYKGEKREGEYNRMFISGNGLEEIPVLCLRKEAELRKQKKDALCSQISVKSIGKDKYYGFELGDNHQYLLGNFIVTHNTTIFREGLAKALDRPFASFSLSGMSDESYLSGFAHTYEGSDYGRICRMLTETGCMNPIIFMDELDKIDTTRHGSSVVNKIMEIIDFAQNHEYEDMYFGNIKIDLSRVLFVFSLNHIDLIDPILKDRLEVITIKGFKPKERVTILKDYIIPKELEEIGLNENDIIFPENIISFIVKKICQEEGVRGGKRAIQTILRKINLLQYVNNIDKEKKFSYFSKNIKLPIIITEDLVNKLLVEEERPIFLNLYM